MPRIVVGLISIGKRLAVKVKPGRLTGCAELPSHIGIERAIHKEKIIKRIFPSVSRWTFPVFKSHEYRLSYVSSGRADA